MYIAEYVLHLVKKKRNNEDFYDILENYTNVIISKNSFNVQQKKKNTNANITFSLSTHLLHLSGRVI
jgi:hypothetical protein